MSAPEKTSPQAKALATPRVEPLAENETSATTTPGAMPNNVSSLPSSPDVRGDQTCTGSQSGDVSATLPATAASASTTMLVSPWLADPILGLAADVLGDLESVRVANQNRLRQLTRTEPDKDGEERGFGLDQSHPDVKRLTALVDALTAAEHQATLNVQRLMRRHPLGPWMAGQRGIGEKQGARLLAAIGDPYVRDEIAYEDRVEPPRPRTVSELWAYMGLHVLPADQGCLGAQARFVGGNLPDGHPDHDECANQLDSVGVAPFRKRGQKANWNSETRKRAWVITPSIIKTLKQATCPIDPDLGYAIHADICDCSPYRRIYDDTKAHYHGATHKTECKRCGPEGKPARQGSPLSAGHIDGRARRKVMKEIAKDLWREAKRLHQANTIVVDASQWDNGHELHVRGHGVTQCADAGDAERMVRDYVSLAADVSRDDFDIEIRWAGR